MWDLPGWPQDLIFAIDSGKNGKQVDPFKEDIPSVEPVQKEYIPYFDQQMTKLRQQLDAIKRTMDSEELLEKFYVAEGNASTKPAPDTP